ncbi:MAG: hypothetical protein Q8R11_03450, partial [bacterium]|nr:hypothetical protein [bacterium]
MIERGRSIEVRTHLGDFLPYAAIVPNKTVVGWSKRSGADGLEWVGARLPTVEVNLCSTGYLKKAFQGHLKSGHAVFGQHFTFLSAFRLLIDQSYPVSWKTILPMKVMTVEEQTSKRALIKLQSLLGNDFPITVYPPYGNIGIEEEYSKPLVQIVGGMTSAELEDPVAHWIALY